MMSIQEKPFRGELVYKLLDILLVKDFDENTYDCPTWLGAVTNYYSNKDIVIDLLKVLNIDMPKNIHDFRLPIDWTEEELDMFFETMHNHANCNACCYSDNLRFWKPYCLDNVAIMVNRSYSEIPWQFVLRNPLIKKEEYLKQIGEHAFVHNTNNWTKFFSIDKYQNLSVEEIKIILNNMTNIELKKTSSDELKRFILKNIEHIEDKKFLTAIYDKWLSSYTVNYTDTLLKFPYEFIKRYFSENKSDDTFKLLNRYKEEFTEQQRKELILLLI